MDFWRSFYSKLDLRLLLLLRSICHRVSQDQNPLHQMVLADLADGTPEKWHLHAVDATDAGDKDLQNRVDHGAEGSQSLGRVNCSSRELEQS
jgi:hypothetical protein